MKRAITLCVKFNFMAQSIQFSFIPYIVELRHTFSISNFSRKQTPAMLVKLEWEGYTGYGEASMPPYLGESIETATKFYKALKISQFSNPFLLDEILTYVDETAPGNTAAKAAVDIALHDLKGKILNQPLHQLLGYDIWQTPPTSYTIGIDEPQVVQEKTREHQRDFKLLKIKVGKSNYQSMIENVRQVFSGDLCVDANQDWEEKESALEMIHWMNENGVIFVEQPMHKKFIDETAWLTENSPLPIIADESVQRLQDLYKLKGVFSGVNIKLMKSTGIREAQKMLYVAEALGLKKMMGVMTETSCGVSAAAQLSALADWVDLDGHFLISNDPFTGLKLEDGKVISAGVGLGLEKKDFLSL